MNEVRGITLRKMEKDEWVWREVRHFICFQPGVLIVTRRILSSEFFNYNKVAYKTLFIIPHTCS